MTKVCRIVSGRSVIDDLSQTLNLPPNVISLSIVLRNDSVAIAECVFDIPAGSDLVKVLKKYELQEIPEEKGSL